jgi:hypothetical protein
MCVAVGTHTVLKAHVRSGDNTVLKFHVRSGGSAELRFPTLILVFV